MRKLAVLMLVAYATLLTAACNTVEGFGRDVERVGDKIERKAADERRR